MTNEQIKTKLAKVNELLTDILPAIKLANANGKQFDYCTDPRLSDTVSSVESKAAQIHAIVYQGN